MGLRFVIDRIGRAVDPAGPDVYDCNHHLGRYADEEHRRRTCFSRHDGPPYYSPRYGEWFDDDGMPL